MGIFGPEDVGRGIGVGVGDSKPLSGLKQKP